MDEELLKEMIQDLALALLYKEYGKDMRNHDAIRMLADGEFSKYAAVKRGDAPSY